MLPRGGPPRGHLYSACVKLKVLQPVIVHSIPELWTTRERRYAGHKSRESAIRAEKDVLRWPRVVTPHKASCLGRNICCLKQPSTASRVRVSKVRWCSRIGRCWMGFSRGCRKFCQFRRSHTPCFCQRPALALGQMRGWCGWLGGLERSSLTPGLPGAEEVG